jgi:hypothetical protein
MWRLIKRRLRVSLSAMVMEHPPTIELTVRRWLEGVNSRGVRGLRRGRREMFEGSDFRLS